jgi:hypothetical protein
LHFSLSLFRLELYGWQSEDALDINANDVVIEVIPIEQVRVGDETVVLAEDSTQAAATDVTMQRGERLVRFRYIYFMHFNVFAAVRRQKTYR